MKRAALLPLLLTGCQQGHVSTLPAAQHYVDSLLSAQLLVVKVEQESLALASGLNFAPVKRATPLTPSVNLAGSAAKKPAPITGHSVPLPPGPRLMPGLQQVRYDAGAMTRPQRKRTTGGRKCERGRQRAQAFTLVA